MKGELVSALCCCARDRRRSRTRRFLQGLSSDELQYIADFLGSRILEANHRIEYGRGPLSDDIASFERCRLAGCEHDSRYSPASLRDHDHKMILLLEYLERCGTQADHAAQA